MTSKAADTWTEENCWKDKTRGMQERAIICAEAFDAGREYERKRILDKVEPIIWGAGPFDQVPVVDFNQLTEIINNNED